MRMDPSVISLGNAYFSKLESFTQMRVVITAEFSMAFALVNRHFINRN